MCSEWARLYPAAFPSAGKDPGSLRSPSHRYIFLFWCKSLPPTAHSPRGLLPQKYLIAGHLGGSVG